MALPSPAIFRTKSKAVPNIIDSAVSVGAYGWPDECQGRKNNDVLMKRLTNTRTRTGKNNNKKKEKDEEEHSAPQLKKRKNGKEIPTESTGSLVLGLAREETSDLVTDDRRRRLVDMANSYLQKHCSEDAYNGGDGSSPKRQRLGD
ncbi:unnamed protein product [Linum trigynum]|uniref:Uncharacterized protein n=1 Tax=Linum trigynum TaxID=586398 RepID=A0AAV2F6M7_9ROSI